MQQWSQNCTCLLTQPVTCPQWGALQVPLNPSAGFERTFFLTGAVHGQVVQQLARQVEETSAAMLQALLSRLKGSIQLPDCLRVVGYLRRLSAFPEAVSTPA